MAKREGVHFLPCLNTETDSIYYVYEEAPLTLGQHVPLCHRSSQSWKGSGQLQVGSLRWGAQGGPHLA